jgi:hypothetical protein
MPVQLTVFQAKSADVGPTANGIWTLAFFFMKNAEQC